MDKDPQTLSAQLRRFMKLVAVMGSVLLLVTLVLKLAGVHYNDALLTTGFGTLAIVAFMLGKIFPANSETPMAPIWNFAMTITGYSLASALIGLLFLMQHWPGSKTLLLLGLGSLLLSGAAWLFYFLRRNRQ